MLQREHLVVHQIGLLFSLHPVLGCRIGHPSEMGSFTELGCSGAAAPGSDGQGVLFI
uniref:Uncharacterized protein n=1 Tax=Setaria viridis TaxID=4556 RepID=A0A4V6Y8R1_SETVI|nr:hypothetical protein SEVIR_3G359950v2 [Setaria viridis]